MTIDLDKLEAAAKAATSGPWVATKEYANRWGVSPSPTDIYPVASVYGHGDLTKIEADATYIAATNPAAVLELIRRLRDAEVDAKRYRYLRNEDAWPTEIYESIGYGKREDFDIAVDDAIATQGASHD